MHPSYPAGNLGLELPGADALVAEVLQHWEEYHVLWTSGCLINLEAPLQSPAQALIASWITHARRVTREQLLTVIIPSVSVFGQTYANAFLAIYDSMFTGSREHLEQLPS